MAGREEDPQARLRVSVLRERCAGAGQCVLTAPAVFSQDEGGIVRLIITRPGPGEHEIVWAAAGYCPSRAIRVVADDGPD
jgi:ferredoxin